MGGKENGMSDLISRQEALKELAAYIHLIDKTMGKGTLTDDDCMEAAKSVLGEDELPAVQPEQRWIPCTERLPEDGRYLVTRFDFVTNTCFLDILWYEKGVWWNRLYTGDFAVIAWMPLPEPYR